jgi:predicted glycosyltransferase
MSQKRPKVWFDFSNPPHVNLFLPLLNYFQNEGIETHCTARDFVETTGLLNKYGIKYQLFGNHGGKNRLVKLYKLIWRNIKLYRHLPSFDYNISSSFEAAQVSWLKRKPAIFFDDNEIAPNWVYSKFVKHVFIPIHINKKLFIKDGVHDSKIVQYNGYKEHIYIADYQPDPDFMKSLPFDSFITIRPENLKASYVPDQASSIVPELVRTLIDQGQNILYLPRYKDDQDYVGSHRQVFTPDQPLNGLDVCYYSDAVLTGAGTFAREAAILGTPAISFFAGKKLLSVDESMVKSKMMHHSRDVNTIINILASSKKSPPQFEESKKVQKEVINLLKNIVLKSEN